MKLKRKILRVGALGALAFTLLVVAAWLAVPLIPLPSSEASNNASAATSSEVISRFCGLIRLIAARASVAERPVFEVMFSMPCVVMSVST